MFVALTRTIAVAGRRTTARNAAVSATAALLLALSPVQVAGQTLATETFNGVPNDFNRVGLTGAIPGTGLAFTDGVGEIIVDPTEGGRGKYLWMRLGWYVPGYNTITNIGTSTLQSTRRFDLFAGTTYTLSFDWTRQGFSAGNGPFPFSLTAMLGSSSLTLNDNAGFYFGENWQTARLTFTPLVTELNAILAFAGSGLAYSGAYLDNISLVGVAGPTPPAPGVVPEPETWALMVTGFAMLTLVARRRQPMQRA